MPQETEITGWVYQNEPAALRSGRVSAAAATEATPATDTGPLSNYNPTASTKPGVQCTATMAAFQGSTMLSGTSWLQTEHPHVTSSGNYGEWEGLEWKER